MWVGRVIPLIKIIEVWRLALVIHFFPPATTVAGRLGLGTSRIGSGAIWVQISHIVPALVAPAATAALMFAPPRDDVS